MSQQAKGGGSVAVRDEVRVMAERQVQFTQILNGDNFRKALASVLPTTVTPERIIRVVLSAMQAQPKLLQCAGDTVILSILRAASMGLEPDGGTLGQGYLVPFWSGKNRRLECQFIPGYRGLVKLAANSGEVADVSAEVVYEGDTFRYELGLQPTLEHVRNDKSTGERVLAYVYAIARFRDAAVPPKFIVLNRADVEKIKETTASRNKNGEIVGPWVEWESEMWKKTAIRRLCKQLPLSIERQTLIQAEPSERSPSTSGELLDTGSLGGNLPAIESDQQQQDDEAGEDEQQAGDKLVALIDDEFVRGLELCQQKRDVDHLVDAWFGPERKHDFTHENEQRARALAAVRVEQIAGSRGQRSNKKDGKLFEASANAAEA